MTENAIEVEHISKVYPLYDNARDRLREFFSLSNKKYHHEFPALQDVSFSVKKGETLGIVGVNGSGKSTLLKIITGVLQPTSGTVRCNGRISSLLELGTGFHPEFTGRANVYMNGALLGYTKEEMDAKLPAIQAFADIGEFIDQPVRTYSSGMYVRLAFASAINVDPDIIIIDEALSVGDLRFQQKCLRKLSEFQDSGKTIFFVTHDMGTIKNFCRTALWLDKGEKILLGDAESVAKRFIAFMMQGAETEEKREAPSEPVAEEGGKENARSQTIVWVSTAACASYGERGVTIDGVACYDAETKVPIELVEGGELVTLALRVNVHKRIERPLFGFLLNDRFGNHITGMNTFLYNTPLRPLIPEEPPVVTFTFRLPKLMNGQYTISPSVAEGTQSDHIQHHWVHDALVLRIASGDPRMDGGYYIVIDEATIAMTPQE